MKPTKFPIMCWSCTEKGVDVAEQIKHAAAFYEKKYGHKVNQVTVHHSLAGLTIKGINIIPSKAMLLLDIFVTHMEQTND